MLTCHVDRNISRYTSECISDVFEKYPSPEDTSMRSSLFCSNKKYKTLHKVANKASSVVNHSRAVEDLEKTWKPYKKESEGGKPLPGVTSNFGRKCSGGEQPEEDEEEVTEAIEWAGRTMQWRKDVLEIPGFASCLFCRSQGVLGEATGHVHLPAHQEVCWCVLKMGRGKCMPWQPSSSSRVCYSCSCSHGSRIIGSFLGRFPTQIRLTQPAWAPVR